MCGPVCREYSALSGILNSPYYPIRYTDGAECIYKISQNNSTYIKLTFSQLDVYNDDILEIRDGSSEESPLIGKFSGALIPENKVLGSYYDNLPTVPSLIESTQNNMWIRYLDI